MDSQADSPQWIFRLIEDQQWEEALAFVKECPRASKISLGALENDDGDSFETSHRNFNLALHEACKRCPPASFVEALLIENEEAAKHVGECGYLPLHFACSCNASDKVVEYLIEAYSEGTTVRDTIDNALPLHMAAKWGATEQVIWSLLIAYPEASLLKDGERMTPMEHAQRQATAKRTNGTIAALEQGGVLVKVANGAWERAAAELDLRTRGIQRANEEFMRQLQQRHDEEIQEMKARELDLQKQVKYEKERNSEHEREHQVLEEQLNKTKADYDELAQAREADKRKVDAKIKIREQELQIVITDSVGKVEQLKEQLEEANELKNLNSNLQLVCDDLQTAMDRKQAELEEKSSIIRHLQELLEVKEDKINGLHFQLENNENAQQAVHRLETSKLFTENQTLKDMLCKAQSKVELSEARLKSVKRKISSLNFAFLTWAKDDYWVEVNNPTNLEEPEQLDDENSKERNLIEQTSQSPSERCIWKPNLHSTRGSGPPLSGSPTKNPKIHEILDDSTENTSSTASYGRIIHLTDSE